MDFTRPFDEGDDGGTAEVISRSARVATPSPEDRSMEGASRTNHPMGGNTSDSTTQVPLEEPSFTHPMSNDRNITTGDRSNAEGTSMPNQTGQQDPTPARTTEEGWFNPFSPNSRRSTQQFAPSSSRAIQEPDAVIPSIGTQPLMPPRDPMAAFNSKPVKVLYKKKEIDPVIDSGIPVNRDQARPFVPHGYPRKRIPAAPTPTADYMRHALPKNSEEKEKWRVAREVVDLTKQRNEDRAKGLMPPPPPRIPVMPVCIKPPTAEERAALPPAFRRKCEAWEKAHKVELEEKAVEKAKEKHERWLVHKRDVQEKASRRLFGSYSSASSSRPRESSASMSPSTMPAPKRHAADKQLKKRDVDNSSDSLSSNSQPRRRRAAALPHMQTTDIKSDSYDGDSEASVSRKKRMTFTIPSDHPSSGSEQSGSESSSSESKQRKRKASASASREPRKSLSEDSKDHTDFLAPLKRRKDAPGSSKRVAQKLAEDDAKNPPSSLSSSKDKTAAPAREQLGQESGKASERSSMAQTTFKQHKSASAPPESPADKGDGDGSKDVRNRSV